PRARPHQVAHLDRAAGPRLLDDGLDLRVPIGTRAVRDHDRSHTTIAVRAAVRRGRRGSRPLGHARCGCNGQQSGDDGRPPGSTPHAMPFPYRVRAPLPSRSLRVRSRPRLPGPDPTRPTSPPWPASTRAVTPPADADVELPLGEAGP